MDNQERTRRGADWRGLAPFFAANVLFGSGLFAHAFLYNFYLDALGFSEAAMGAAAAFLTAGGLLALAPAGAAVDRWGARPVYLAAVVLAAAGLAAGAWAERPWTVFAAALVAGLGTASWRVTMGPLLMAAPADVRPRAFSWNVGLLLASGAGWTWASGATSAWVGGHGAALEGLRTALWLGAAGTATAAGIFLVSSLDPPRGSEERGAAPPPLLARLAVPRGVVVLVSGVFVWMLGAALVLPFFNLWFQRVQGMPVERIGGVFALAQGVAALALFGGAELARAVGPRRAFVRWAAVLPVALAALAMGPAGWMGVALFVVQGLPSPATNPLLDQVVLEAAPPQGRGAASSWRNAATEASGLVGAALGGILLQRFGFPTLLLAGALVAAVGTAFLVRAFRATPAGAS